MPPVLKSAAEPFPSAPLYYRAKKGALHKWRVWVVGASVFTEYGQVDGKQQQTPGKKCTAMNVGQANERSCVQQALSVARSMHKFKLDRKYALNPDDAIDAKYGLPMLAHRYDQRPKHIGWPADFQPKLDGNRANARWQGEGVVDLVSRSGVDTYDLPHLQEALQTWLPADCELDGELYIHGVAPETINSWCSGTHPESATLEYHVYDMPIVRGDDKLPWIKRHAAMVDLFEKIGDHPHLKLVTTTRVRDYAAAEVALTACLEAGYEGGMLRNLNGIYTWGDRSNDLQKLKVFEDGEFEVVGCTEGVGKMEGCAIWKCKMVDGKTFTCTMKAPMEVRRQHYTDRAKHIGKVLTVNYFGFFASGLPRFPRAVKFRLSKDT